MSCHAGKEELTKAAQAAGKSETLEQYAKDYPLGPHDQPQSMCPAFGSLRVGLRMRRTATILSGSACCVYGLTFTSHFYGARRTRGLCALQFRDAGDGQAVRGHPRGGVQAGEARGLRRHRHHQSLRSHRLRRAAATAAEGNQRRAHHRHRRAGLRRADPCGSQGRALRRHAEICRRAKSARARLRHRAPRAARFPPSRCWARCSRPIPSASAACWSRWGLPPARSFRRANGASCSRPSIAPPLRRSTPSTPPRSASSRRRAAPSSAPLPWAMTAPPPGSPPSARPATSRRQDRRRAERHPPRHQGRACGKAHQGPHHGLGLRRLGASRRAPADRERRGGALCRHRLPAHPLVGCRPRMAGGARRHHPVPRLARERHRRDAGCEAGPRHRHHAGGAEGQVAVDPRRSTSPT